MDGCEFFEFQMHIPFDQRFVYLDRWRQAVPNRTQTAAAMDYDEALQSVLNRGLRNSTSAYFCLHESKLYLSPHLTNMPIYSGLFTVVSHLLILGALNIYGDVCHWASFSSPLSHGPEWALTFSYSSSDFLLNLLVLLFHILNSGMSDSGLLLHLFEVTAGFLNRVGHQTAHEKVATYL